MSISEVERYVQDADKDPTPLDGDGFLDPTAAGITPAGDLAGRPQSFVLLAAGGVGKTFTLRGLRQQEDGYDVRLVGLRGTEIDQEIKAAVATGRPVYLDSLDEALASDPTLGRRLSQAMSGPGTAGVRWRLACRPSAWTTTLIDGVPNVEQLRLLPMTRDAARRLLISRNTDPAFLDVLVAADLSRLSSSPLQFQAAAQQWQKDGALPLERKDVLESEVDRRLGRVS